MSGINNGNYYNSNNNNNNSSYCNNPFKQLKILASSGYQTGYSSDKNTSIYSSSNCGSTFNSSGLRSMTGQGSMW